MKKNTYILMGLFGCLLVIAFLVLQKPGEQSANSSGAGFLFTIDSVSVDKIEIKAPASSLQLEKRGTDWFVVQPVQYRADQAKIGQLLHQVKNIELKNIVSNKPEKHSVFQVDQTGIQVTVYDKGSEKASFVVGKMAAGYMESYIRKSNSNDVLIADGASSTIFDRPVKEWRDRTVFSAPKESIKEIRYQYGDTSFTLAFRDSSWFAGNENAQPSVVEGIVSSLVNFQADDFIDSTILPKVTAIVTYAGSQVQFSFDKTTSKYFVRSSNSPQWFIVEQWKANQILKRKKEITGSIKP
jgi:hypothetical protein